LKLNIGSGPVRLPGYISLDAAPYPGVEIVADLGQKPVPLPDGSCEAILAHDILEHLPRWEALFVLRDCWRLLQPGGTLEIRVPDTEAIIAADGPVDWKVTLLYGGQDQPQGVPTDAMRDDHPHLFCHRYGWTADTLAAACRQSWLEVVETVKAFPNMILRARRP
jgi:predicted SAM-dependent methyltransferase